VPGVQGDPGRFQVVAFDFAKALILGPDGLETFSLLGAGLFGKGKGLQKWIRFQRLEEPPFGLLIKSAELFEVLVVDDSGGEGWSEASFEQIFVDLIVPRFAILREGGADRELGRVALFGQDRSELLEFLVSLFISEHELSDLLQ
jgi:hypothetical protein